jgi:hypothetical protein
MSTLLLEILSVSRYLPHVKYNFVNVILAFGARGIVVGLGTMLQARRSRIRFSMRSFDFSAALWPWDRLSL